MKALILDATHGGNTLSLKYVKAGWNVTCVDVYSLCTDEQIHELEAMGVRYCLESPSEEFDVLISPVHCPDSFILNAKCKTRKTFSQAVFDLIDNKIERIEVTGVKGKTSTCYLLAHVLDTIGKKVYLHTSRGDGEYKNGTHLIEKKRSIAPVSLLEMPSSDYDIIICEVSLGGSGKADVSVITNLVEDYGIAKNTRKASDAKADIFSSGKNIVPFNEIDIWKKYGFSIRGYEKNAKIVGKPSLGNPLEISFNYQGEERKAVLNSSYLSYQYLSSIDVVLKICEEMNIPSHYIIQALESFMGVPGRGEIVYCNNIVKIIERNPGISQLSIDKTLSSLKEMGCKNIFAILDPVNRKVCDKLDMESIKQVFDLHEVKFAMKDSSVIDIDGYDTIVEFIKEGYA